MLLVLAVVAVKTRAAPVEPVTLMPAFAAANAVVRWADISAPVTAASEVTARLSLTTPPTVIFSEFAAVPFSMVTWVVVVLPLSAILKLMVSPASAKSRLA